jgi:glycosyltransferase involved in cell wall biosynthesis
MTDLDAHAPLATVAVCTRNRRESLLVTLDSLAGQEAGFEWEVLVVDNGSEDGSVDAARERSEQLRLRPFRVEVEPRAGVSIARNRALESARGRWIVFIDDDVWCEPGLLAAYADVFEREDPAGAGGRVVPRIPDELPPWLRELLAQRQGGPTSRYDYGLTPAKIVPDGPIPVPFGANMAVSREAALRAGGFREDLGWGPLALPGEETELYLRLLSQGGRIFYVPQASVLHRVEPARLQPDAVVDWHRTYGRSQAVFRREAGREPDWSWWASERFKVAFYTIAGLLAWQPVRRLRYRCKRAACRGRLEQLREF